MQLKRGSVRGEGKGNLSTRIEISNLFKYNILRLDSLVKELVLSRKYLLKCSNPCCCSCVSV